MPTIYPIIRGTVRGTPGGKGHRLRGYWIDVFPVDVGATSQFGSNIRNGSKIILRVTNFPVFANVIRKHLVTYHQGSPHNRFVTDIPALRAALTPARRAKIDRMLDPNIETDVDSDIITVDWVTVLGAPITKDNGVPDHQVT